MDAKILLSGLVACTALLPVPTLARPPVAVWPDAEGVGDILRPDRVTEETPVALVIHGGGWTAMGRADVRGIADFLRDDLGCIVYNVDYRLAGGNTPWPACGDDCVKAANAMFTDAFAAAAGVKPGKIWILGASAGGHLALWTGLTLPPEKVAGIVSISGIADPEVDFPSHPGMYAGLFGKASPGDVTRAMRDTMSVMRLIRPGAPKVLLTHESDDAVVPIATAKSFLAADRAAGNEVGLFEYSRALQPGTRGHCIWIPGSKPHRLIPRLEREIAYFIRPPAVPAPRPVKSAVELSALYYPGTEHMPEWDMIRQVAPGRRPLLGWYDESDPENVDWQVKWAVEHGISSFCVCWYWNRGVQRLDHWVNAFYRSKHRRHLKWYVMYANHNEPGAHSPEDQAAVTKFWIDNYFRTPEYFKIDGRPVVVYCTSSHLDRDFIAAAKAKGEDLKPGEGIRRAREISERLAKAAGFPGLYWIDMKWLRSAREWSLSSESFATAHVARFDAMMTYNLGGQTPFGMSPEARRPGERPRCCRYDLQVLAAEKLAARADAFGIPFWPTVPTGYDDTVRAFQRAWVVTDRTPEKFRAACASVRRAADEKGLKRVMISPINEWQEGSYIEPCDEYGFAYYDAIRDAFCEKPADGWPADDTPASLGLPLHEFPPMRRSSVQNWTFDESTEGWYRQPFGCCRTRCVNGCLEFLVTRDDLFQIRQRVVPFEASRYGTFRLRMRVKPNARDGLGRFAAKGIRLRLKWGTAEDPIIGLGNSLDFQERVAGCPVLADGGWHEYAVDLARERDWYGPVDELWLEAVNVNHAVVDIDWMRFEGASEAPR